MSNKNRIYFCVYRQQGFAGSDGNPRVFHCGLWVESKSSRGGGHYFHVQFHGRRPVNRPNYPDGWEYGTSVTRDREANWRQSNNIIGRILLGKLPAGVDARHIHQICAAVRMPREGTDENCWDWAHWAIRDIQRQGWLQSFPWSGRDGFAARAQRQAVKWYEGDRGRVPANHKWDYFGIESGGHCAVM
ncbi:uncharacterized protein B0H64DRAFT_204567 [Chaetomium fimeti]|uniref:Uncharacterized protein n=1 Tax=Chaetomium fimeti TaxID=1854472 RepID=A0AAE0HAL0_9PEZI|nr:hypothetical protein B0H64DRAFT_204567 [Chaetomium fimeti]